MCDDILIVYLVFQCVPHLDYEIIVLFPFIPLIILYFLLLCKEIKHEPFFFLLHNCGDLG